MGYTGINLENVKVSNRSAILKLLNDRRHVQEGHSPGAGTDTGHGYHDLHPASICGNPCGKRGDGRGEAGRQEKGVH